MTDPSPALSNLQRETFDLPSGARLEFRKLLVGDENRLAKAQNAKGSANRVLHDVLAGCCTAVVDAGPYAFLRETGKLEWRKMLLGDRLATIINLRILSYTEREIFTIFGARCPYCGKATDYDIDLLRDVVWRPIAPEVRKQFEAGVPFEAQVDGRTVKFTMGTGESEELNERLGGLHPDREMACMLRSRIVSVEGIDISEVLDWIDGNNGESRKYSGITSADAELLRDAFDQVECGIDTEIELVCGSITCASPFQIRLPFDGMLMPSKGIQARRRARRRGTPS